MLKMGKISYTNILPLYYFFNDRPFTDKLKVIPQTPAQLNQKMKTGEIDFGPMSSFAYVQNQSSYLLLPNLSISSAGKVRSIFLFSKKPLCELNQARIALTSSSATSVALLKIILESFYQLTPSYQTMDPHLPEMLKEHDAALLIGDDALWAKWENNSCPYIYDLGEEWWKWTQKPMTFAVWAIRREVTRTHPQLVMEIYNELLESKIRGETGMDQMINDLCHSFGGSISFWEEYFAGLSYDFEPFHQQGLTYFYQLAYQLGLLKESPKINVWEPGDAIYL